jgi:hypothetical protein
LDRFLTIKRLKELKVKVNIFSNFYKARIYNLSKPIVILLAAITFLSLPWIFAITGNYVSDAPLLGEIFLGRQIPNLEGQEFAAVHVGQHHGYDGFVAFSLMILVLPLASWIYNSYVKSAVGMMWSIFIVYSLYNFAEDFVNEQIFKRFLIQNFLPGAYADVGIVLPYSIFVGIFVYMFVWRKQENKYFKKR